MKSQLTKITKLFVLFALVSVLIGGSLKAEEPATAFKNAYEQALKGETTAALDGFEALLARTPRDPDLLYNAGTTALLAGKLGYAVLYLERALAIDADCADCRENLARALEKQQDQVIVQSTADQQSGASLDGLMESASLDGLAIVLTIANILLCLVFFMRRFAHGERARFALSLTLAGVLLLALVVGGLTAMKGYGYETRRYAVVVEREQPVRKGPNLNFESEFSVHEGLKVRLGERVEDWQQVWLENGLNGFVPERSLGAI